MKREEYSIIEIYVDDLLLFCKTKEHIASIKSPLIEDFIIKYLRDLKYCLGIEIHRKREDGWKDHDESEGVQQATLGEVRIENCKDVLNEAPVFKDVAMPTAPHLDIDVKGNLNYSEVPRPSVRKLEHYVREMAEGKTLRVRQPH